MLVEHSWQPKHVTMQAIIFTGLQASGKSTFYKNNFLDTHVRINLDMLGGSRSKERKLIAGCVSGNIPSVVDNTNLTPTNRLKYIEIFREAGYDLHSYFFDSLLEDCLVRNKERKDKEPIPPVALYSGNKKLVVPNVDEGFSRVSVVKIVTNGNGFDVQECL